jgi:hypothetical protein
VSADHGNRGSSQFDVSGQKKNISIHGISWVTNLILRGSRKSALTRVLGCWQRQTRASTVHCQRDGTPGAVDASCRFCQSTKPPDRLLADGQGTGGRWGITIPWLVAEALRIPLQSARPLKYRETLHPEGEPTRTFREQSEDEIPSGVARQELERKPVKETWLMVYRG